MDRNFEKIFMAETFAAFHAYKDLGDKAMAQITDDTLLHWSPNEDVNSIAVIINHLSGNMMSRWTDFLTTDGEKEWRDRDAEFIDQVVPREQIMASWEKGWQVLFATLDGLTADDLTQTVYINGVPTSVVKALIRQLSHYSYHIGQIVHVAKELQSDKWVSLSTPRKK